MNIHVIRAVRIEELKHEQRMLTLRLKSYQHKIQLATADFLTVDELGLELPGLERALADYTAALTEYAELTARLQELEA